MKFNSWSLVIGLVIIVALSTAAWFLSPKGDNQTLFRSTLILTFVSCYLMWGMFLVICCPYPPIPQSSSSHSGTLLSHQSAQTSDLIAYRNKGIPLTGLLGFASILSTDNSGSCRDILSRLTLSWDNTR
ncbi:hypothetical protein N7524_008733 [Penicillium chrysogenum]|nr:hypothetical protein N7524_008733 [Penicillium chrysogenum]